MRKILHLSTCDTCQRILKELQLEGQGFMLQDIKTEPIKPEDLDKAVEVLGSYEAMFSRRARKYAERGLKDVSLSEQDIRNLILEEYTFLKRPLIFVDEMVFTGNTAATVAAAKKAIHGK